MQTERNIAIVLVSHSMEDVAKYVNRILVMNKGELLYDDSVREVFAHYKELEAVGLRAPEITYIMNYLSRKGFNVDTGAVTVKEAYQSLIEAIKEK